MVKVPVIEMTVQGEYWASQEERSLVLDALSLRHLLVIQAKMTFYWPVCFTDPAADSKEGTYCSP